MQFTCSKRDVHAQVHTFKCFQCETGHATSVRCIQLPRCSRLVVTCGAFRSFPPSRRRRGYGPHRLAKGRLACKPSICIAFILQALMVHMLL